MPEENPPAPREEPAPPEAPAPVPPAPAPAPQEAPEPEAPREEKKEEPAPEKKPEPRGEAVLITSRISRKAYLLPYLIALALIAAGACFMFMPSVFSILGAVADMGIPFAYLLYIGLAILVIMEIFIRTRDELLVKETGVTEKKGILSKHDLTVDYGDITTITVRQGIFARIMGYGALSLDIKSGQPLVLHKIAKPDKLRAVIEEQIRKTTGQFQPPAQPPGRPPEQPPAQPPVQPQQPGQ